MRKNFWEKYTIDKIKKGIQNPALISNELRILAGRITSRLFGFKFTGRYGDPINVMEQDWDNLIILDACRYDIFLEVNTIEGDLKRVISGGSQSAEFLAHNFANREFHDTIYVTANPHATKLDPGTFHDTIFTFEDDFFDGENRKGEDWRERLAPDHVLDTALSAHNKYPNKRLIVHFMQPHGPYFGGKGRHLRQTLRDEYGLRFSNWDGSRESETDNQGNVYPHLLSAAEDGYLSHDDIREIYAENIRIVLEHVQSLITEIDGYSVVTSDHGELLGDAPPTVQTDQDWKHPREVWLPELRFVPWLKISANTRREITTETPKQSKDINSEVIDKQLKALGYV